MREKFLTEARILELLKHAHIVKLIGVCSCEPPYLMIIELMSEGDLLKLLRSAEPLERADQDASRGAGS